MNLNRNNRIEFSLSPRVSRNPLLPINKKTSGKIFFFPPRNSLPQNRDISQNSFSLYLYLYLISVCINELETQPYEFFGENASHQSKFYSGIYLILTLTSKEHKFPPFYARIRTGKGVRRKMLSFPTAHKSPKNVWIFYTQLLKLYEKRRTLHHYSTKSNHPVKLHGLLSNPRLINNFQYLFCLILETLKYPPFYTT